MKTLRLETVEVVSELCCDRCGQREDRTESAFHEFTSIDYLGGYASIFGDGTRVQLDICQGCLRELAGPWLRLTPPADNQDPTDCCTWIP